MTDILFQPSADAIEHTQLTAFAKLLEAKSGQTFSDYVSLHKYSIEHLEEFWQSVWQFGGVIGEMGSTVLTQHTMPGAVWFPQARLNFAENLLAHGADDQAAYIAISESRGESSITYAELRRQVGQLATYLKDEVGVQSGDRVAAYVGNTPEALIGMLATAYIGATWCSASPDFGFDGVVDRFGQIEPTVLIAGNGYRYSGKDFDRREVVTQLCSSMPSVRALISVDVLPDLGTLENSINFSAITARNHTALKAEHFEFNHPLYILFSSGTTGKPKCIVHGAGGTLLQHIKEFRLHGDINAQSRFFYFTTTGWMMWNWLASGIVTGATIVLFDGNPMHPSKDVLWQLAKKHRITHFGTSAKYLSACRQLDLHPSNLELTDLRVIFSTGSPLAPEDFEWVYSDIKSDVLLHSISGGTDIVSCFVGGNPWQPVVKGKIQAANLGMAVESWSDDGAAVINQRGELVCTKPVPSMPLKFWQDPNNTRYHAAYFERFAGVWAHGDFCSIDEQGQVVILGRSDTTLNPGGVRIGTAEIYRQVETIDSVMDSLVIGRPIEDDTEVVLFVVLKEGLTLNDELIQSIKTRIRNNTTPRHVPAKIRQVTAIPYTRSGKKVELAVAEILRGDLPKNLTALANPESLEEYKNLTFS